jgi:uroporphyrin-III C-methyltransferase / precorrin-2 dehydrogenase / sirohydrochlorin ferrochelatase
MLSAYRRPSEAAPARIEALAKLPIFFDLAGKRAVIAGGTAPAAWKAELLAAAGAAVEIYAAQPAPELQNLLARGAASGSLTHHARAWRAGDLDGAAIAIADAADEPEARAFYEAAVAAGVPVNVIDKPAFCQFQFGAIVNRSPVVIAISTDGGAPILGQAIRRRIDAILPASLATWGQLAKDVRDTVAACLTTSRLRRAFWDAFAERAFRSAPPANALAYCRDLVSSIAAQAAPSAGRVTLVGAGPGDAELLTLKAVRALQSADIVLYDDLVCPDVLELSRREAKRIAVGKRGQRASCAQGDINALMMRYARDGRHVVRLKSGDPMIFGRAGEEIAELEAAGIAVTVVPGITAGLALASTLGVSLTHRDFAQSVRFVTGHSRRGELPSDLDWRGLADPATTLVFYMGGRTAPEIATRLIAHGLPPSTPVVVAAGVGRSDEQRWVGHLAELTARPCPPGELPVLIAIGRALAGAHTRVPAVSTRPVPWEPELAA